MNVLRWGANMIENASPAGLILAGTAVALTSPPIRKQLRSVAVMATRGVLMAADTLQSTAATLREGVEDIVAEARVPAEASTGDTVQDCNLMQAVKNHGRQLATTAVAGALAVREGLNSIVEEAKEERQAASQEEMNEMPSSLESQSDQADGLEAAEIDIGPDSTRRKRSRSKPTL